MSLQAVDQLISHVSSLSVSSSRVPTTTRDVAWWPIVPCGHSAYTWWGESPTASASSNSAACAANVTAATSSSPAPATPAAAAAAAAAAPQPKKEPKEQKEKEPQAKKPAAPKPAAKAEVVNNNPLFSRLDVRVGQIVSAAKHPNADSLYVEQIDVGNGEIREVVSGLVKYIPLEEFQTKKVFVICNLKPSPLRGVKSFGMVLAASNADKSVVELVAPPAAAKPGDRLVVQEQAKEYDAFKPDDVVDPKKDGNVWASVATTLKTDAEGRATWDGKVLATSTGVATASLKNATIA